MMVDLSDRSRRFWGRHRQWASIAIRQGSYNTGPKWAVGGGSRWCEAMRFDASHEPGSCPDNMGN